MNNLNVFKNINIENSQKLTNLNNTKILYLIWDKTNDFITIVFESNKLIPVSEIEYFLSCKHHFVFKFDLKIEIKFKYENFSIEDVLSYISFICKKNYQKFRTPLFKMIGNNEITENDLFSRINLRNYELIFNIDDNEISRDNGSNDIDEIKKELIKYGINLKLKIEFIKLSIINNISRLENKKTPTLSKIKNYSTNDCKRTCNNIDDLRTNYKINDSVTMCLQIYAIEKKEVTSKKNNQKFKIYNFLLVDDSESINANVIFLSINKEKETFFDSFKSKDWICFNGKLVYNDFLKDQCLSISSYKNQHIHKINIKRNIFKYDINTEIIDECKNKRIELHAHSNMSTMDGIVSATDYLNYAYKLGHKAVAITDLNNIQSFPELHNEYIKKYKNTDFKLIYGSEFNIISSKINYVYNPNNNNLYDKKYVIFDLETTGLSPHDSEIIEFGAVLYEPKTNISKKIDILIKPTKPLSEFTKNLTHLTDEQLQKSGISIEHAMQKIIKIFDDSILVAHNAKFDISFINVWMKKLNYGVLKNTIIDTLPLSQLIWSNRKSYSLKNLCKLNKINYDDETAHRADYDAEVLLELYLKILDKLKTLNNKNLTLTDFNLSKLNLDNKNVYDRMYGHFTTVLAKNKKGLFNLFELISIAHTDNFYSSPKLFKNNLKKYREGLLIGTGLLNSELFDAIINKSDNKILEILSFYDYVEIIPPSLFTHLIQKEEFTKKQINLNLKKIIDFSLKLNKLIIATNTPRYISKNQSLIHEIIINSKRIGNKTHPLFDYRKRVKKYPIYNFKTTIEMKKEFSFLEDEKLIEDIVVNNSHIINDQIEQLFPIKDKLYPPEIENCEYKLKEICFYNAKQKYGEILPKIVEERLTHELDLIIKHKYAVIYWIAHKLVTKSSEEGYLVGSRGSVGSSFVATMANITEINPLEPHYICFKCKHSIFSNFENIKSGYDLEPIPCPKCKNTLTGEGHNIPFATFLGFNADKVPDIDLNFSSEYQHKAHDFIKDMFGEDHVLRAGTISTVANKTAYGYVKAFFENNNFIKSEQEIKLIAKQCEGIKRTTGQHPGGIIVIPKSFNINDFTPMNYPADDKTSLWKTTHFDFQALHDNVLKLDILGHIDPTALKFLHDYTGFNPKNIPTHDNKVLSLFSTNKNLNFINQNFDDDNGALGIPEFGTKFVREMLRVTKPKSFAELVQISGLSHGTDVWIDNGKTLIENKNKKLSEIIGCRDDIMTYLISKNIDPLVSFKIMESVRKGKGVPKEYEILLKSKNVENWYIDSCNKIKYMFPKAHATAYVLMAWRIAWYKINFPEHYYAVFFTTRTDIFDIKTILQGSEYIKNQLKNINIKINAKKADQKEKELQNIYEVAIEMWNRGIKMQNINLELSDANKFKVHNINGKNVIVPPFSAIDGLGITIANNIVNERNNRSNNKFISIQDLKDSTSVNKTQLQMLRDLKVLNDLSDNN